jgi:nitroimidazol reductase NimA-like FMN-containing flavoprotein (pyridoxamine 5'-phosphate oxidase superfamily)
VTDPKDPDASDFASRELSVEECRHLLRTVPIGRVIHTERALPALTPVNFRVDDGDVVLHAASRSPLGRLGTGTVVSFEVDDFDATDGTGWSVVLTGKVTAEELMRSHNRNDRVIRLHPEVITGQRLDMLRAR